MTNAAAIAALAKKTSASKLWNGPFTQLGNSKVEAAFADHRTYVYKGKEVDQQVHLGFDLAVTSRVPIVAANAGTVLNASWLGIYGNCVIIDHGMGVQSLYGHLSSFDVKVGDTVTKGQTIGRSGMTGLAGGDHLHFTMLVNGQMVNPVEWWDPHWIDDRVQRKLGEAGRPRAPPPVPRRRRDKVLLKVVQLGYALIYRSGEVNAFTKYVGQCSRADARGVGGGVRRRQQGNRPAETADAPAGGGQKVDPATAGEVNGVVTFEGTAPKNEPIKMNADPVCVKANTTPQEQETYVVTDGKLANVFVYVKDGLSAYSFDPPTGMLTIDQKNCRYHPHVFGARVGQALRDRQQRSDAPQHPRAARKTTRSSTTASRSRA